jgi:hypothetical protein
MTTKASESAGGNGNGRNTVPVVTIQSEKMQEGEKTE